MMIDDESGKEIHALSPFRAPTTTDPPLTVRRHAAGPLLYMTSLLVAHADLQPRPTDDIIAVPLLSGHATGQLVPRMLYSRRDPWPCCVPLGGTVSAVSAEDRAEADRSGMRASG